MMACSMWWQRFARNVYTVLVIAERGRVSRLWPCTQNCWHGVAPYTLIEWLSCCCSNRESFVLLQSYITANMSHPSALSICSAAASATFSRQQCRLRCMHASQQRSTFHIINRHKNAQHLLLYSILTAIRFHYSAPFTAFCVVPTGVPCML